EPRAAACSVRPSTTSREAAVRRRVGALGECAGGRSALGVVGANPRGPQVARRGHGRVQARPTRRGVETPRNQRSILGIPSACGRRGGRFPLFALPAGSRTRNRTAPHLSSGSPAALVAGRHRLADVEPSRNRRHCAPPASAARVSPHTRRVPRGGPSPGRSSSRHRGVLAVSARRVRPNLGEIEAVRIVFFGSLFCVVYTYVGYPLILWILTRRHRPPRVGGAATLPSVSVIVAARNEADKIRRKIEHTLALDYPKKRLEILIASDA